MHWKEIECQLQFLYLYDQPFREINWQKVDEYRVRGLSWSAVSISRVMEWNGHSLQHAVCGEARRVEKEN